MDNSFLDKLISPKTKAALIFDEKLQALVDANSKTSFPIIKNVPILLTTSESNVESVSDFHRQTNSEFNYIDHYQKDAVEYDYAKIITNRATLHENQRLYQKILRLIPDHSYTVLDVGCGRAWVAQELIKRKDTTIISFDISNQNPIKAINSFPSKNHFGLVGDVYNIPIKTDSIDFIVASEIIEHVANPKLFITKLLDVLKKDGTLIITTPYDEKIETSLCIHCNKPTPRNAHIHSFNEKNFIDYLPQSGVDVNFDKFNNKFLIKLRSHILLQHLPFFLWNGIDKLVNTFFNSPTRLLIKITKK